MKSLIRNIAVYALALFLLTLIVVGVRVTGGAAGFVISGIILSILFFFVKPIINIIGFPLKIISFGLFPLLTHAFLLYLLTVLVPYVTITAFFFPGISIIGFVIPKIFFNSLFSFLAASVIFTIIVKFINWATNQE